MKNNLLSFNKTVRGYRHIQEGIPCQDCSAKYPDLTLEPGAEEREPVDGVPDRPVVPIAWEGDDLKIVAVADGHGDSSCHRSDRGSGFAVDAAVACLRSFGHAIGAGDMPFESPRQRAECMQQLTSTIVAKWYATVMDDLREHAVGEEDLTEAGVYQVAYRNGDRLEHLYGTTLIAALYVGDYLILVQQGDGRCDVFYGDGSIDQPIPWDSRCRGSITTSMCDGDAINGIRSKVIELGGRQVVACFLGSDGVEDSYYDNEETQAGTHRFYMDLVCKLHEVGAGAIESYLDEMLPGFSRRGSADDVSVAGIVDVEATKALVAEYQRRVEEYDHREELRIGLHEAESKVISMTRKHAMLRERVEELKRRLAEFSSRRRRLTINIKRYRNLYEDLQIEYLQTQDDLRRLQRELNSYQYIDPHFYVLCVYCNYPQFAYPLDMHKRQLYKTKARLESKVRSLPTRMARHYELRTKEEAELQESDGIVAELREKLAEAQAEFDEYDEEYVKQKNKVDSYKAQMAVIGDLAGALAKSPS